MPLLDEPSGGLAPIVAREVFAARGRIRDTGLTVLVVEQNARATLALADFAYLVEAGRITGSGPPPSCDRSCRGARLPLRRHGFPELKKDPEWKA